MRFLIACFYEIWVKRETAAVKGTRRNCRQKRPDPIHTMLERAAAPVLKALRLAASVLPRRIFLSLSAAAGGLAGRLSRREREVAEVQIAFAWRNTYLPEHGDCRGKSRPAPGVLALQCFRHAGRAAGETLLLRELVRGQTASGEPLVTSTGEDAMAPLLEGRRSVLALSGHIGCFELLAAYFVSRGVPVTVIGRLPNYSWLADAIDQIRLDYGVDIVWRGRPGAMRMLRRAMTEGRVIAALLDQDSNLPNAFAPFFGEDAASPDTPIRLAISHRLAVVSAFIVRTGPLTHHVTVDEIRYDSSAPDAGETILRTFNSRLEQIICRYPDQWLWWHRRWRRRPGEDYQEHPDLLRSTESYLQWLREKTAPR